jgi:hypothetical protein
MVWLVVLLSAAGCGGGTGDLTGRVTYKGRPVAIGAVVFVGPDGLPHYAGLRPDGSYAITGVPPGELKLGVNSPSPTAATALAAAGPAKVKGRAADAAPPAADVALWFPIPPHLGNPATSQIKTTVRRGANTFDIVLK